jgi:hypothetical protein
MDGSSGTTRRGTRTWKAWVGVAVGLVVAVGLIALIAASASGGGSGGLY